MVDSGVPGSRDVTLCVRFLKPTRDQQFDAFNPTTSIKRKMAMAGPATNIQDEKETVEIGIIGMGW